MLLALPLLAAVTIAGQVTDQRPTRYPPEPPPLPAPSVAAMRAAQPPVIDGRDDDPVWREAAPVTGFQEWRPSEGGPPKLPTEAKIAYDAANLYVFVRAFDPHPDSIITVLARRDYFTPSDMIWLFLDSYHDRRTGYEFGVNPSGVKLDAQIYNDGNEDFAWDAVWDVATHVDSLGWTAEFRIPLSQLRYGRQRSHTFGFTIDRDLYRYAQRVSWPLFRQSKAGFVSQLGEISGLDDLEAPRRLEAAPYVVTKNVSEFTKTGLGRTQDVAAGGVTIEPTTNSGVLRLRQDLRGGESSVGGIVTAVNRDNDAFTSPYLRRNAYVGAADFRHRFTGGRFEISGSLDLSRVAGSAPAIAATQRDAVHYYQRPDASLPYDTTRTSLSGDAEELQIAKVGGAHLLGQTSYQRRSTGFEIDDLGYLQRADQQSWSTWVGYFDRHQRAFYQRFQWNANWWQYWTTAGLPEERAFNTNTHMTFRNTWSFHAGGTLGQLGETYCYSCSRGGPAVRQDPYLAPWAGLIGDDRKAIVPYFWVNYWRGDGGRSKSINLSPELDFKIASRVTASISPSYTRSTNAVQPRGPTTDTSDVTHYLFAHLEQKQFAVTLRFTYPFTATTSIQVYAQPFVSKGTYSSVRA